AEASSGESPKELSDAALLLAQQADLQTKIQKLQIGLSNADDRQRLLDAQRSLAETRVTRLNETLARLQLALGDRQESSAQSLHDMSQSKLNELRDTPEPITLAAQHN